MRAVSNIVATILLILISVVLCLLIYIFCLSLLSTAISQITYVFDMFCRKLLNSTQLLNSS